MRTARIIIASLCVIFIVAAGKTFAVATIFIPEPQPGHLGLMFAGFAVLTGGVFGTLYLVVHRSRTRARQGIYAMNGSDGSDKQTIVRTLACKWGLSCAEAEIAMSIVNGLSNAEIAKRRGSTVATVKSQVGAIFQKSGLATRYQLISAVTNKICADSSPKTTANQPYQPFTASRD